MAGVLWKLHTIEFWIFYIIWFSTGRCTDQVTSKCESDTIEIFIPKQLVMDEGKAVHPQLVMFASDASEHCRATDNGDINYVIRLKLKTKFLCGTKKTTIGKSTKYEGSVVWLDTSTNLVKHLYNFTCMYNDEENVYVLPEFYRQKHIQIEETSKIRVNLDLYRDKNFITSAMFDDVTPTISVGQNVYVSVNISEIKSNNHVSVFAKKCFASYYPVPVDERITHDFIDNGCIDSRDSTVRILSGGNATSLQWKFQMFKWINVTVQKIYIFCEIELCGNDACRESDRDCDSPTDPTVDAANVQTLVVMGTGPIFPQDIKILGNRGGSSKSPDKKGLRNPLDGNPNIVPIVVGTLSGCCLVIIIIAFVIMYRRRKRRRQQKERENEGKNEIEQGFAFAITSSNDRNLYSNNAEERNEENSTKHNRKK